MRRFLRRRFLVPLALASMTGALLSAPPAHAARSDCPGNAFCLWVDANYPGRPWSIGGDWDYGTCWNLPPSINNKASSTYNRRARGITLYDGANCTTMIGEIGPQRFYPTLSINDKITSIRFESW
ncbi:peptidase inhibitor family I36 protein [Planobispora takensis]|uniref:Peptidase inhibitor family I36 n=1 Tax=Planobispora takensis TaxID=1367882 RepID=A0A8J3WU03_9ACTN|nr:peptidase inhibitor family I36 protein [Planobispora takensis]GII01720.1 hypothetical protein Pta02_37280 [Planobispora takensis]